MPVIIQKIFVYYLKFSLKENTFSNPSQNFLSRTKQTKCFVAGVSFIQIVCKGKYFSEALILASTNPQHDKRLLIELPENYKLRTCCVLKLF